MIVRRFIREGPAAIEQVLDERSIEWFGTLSWLTTAGPAVLVEKKALIEAWRGGRPVTRMVPVTTHQGEIEVTLSAPYMRTLEFPKAGSCLKVLDGNAVRTLEAALSDTSKFGMAKSLFMAGRDSGFDMQSREGIEAWMESVRGMPLPPSIPVPWHGAPQGTAARKAAKAKKNKRKALAKRARRTGSRFPGGDPRLFTAGAAHCERLIAPSSIPPPRAIGVSESSRR